MKCSRSCARAPSGACRSCRSAPARRSRDRWRRCAAACASTCRGWHRSCGSASRISTPPFEAGVTHRQLNHHLRNTGLALLRRSRRRCDDRRHGGDARIGHDRRPVRDDARERAGDDGGAGGRPRDSHRHPRAQVVGRLRPDAALRRIRGNARRDHRGDGAPPSASRGDCDRRLPLPHHQAGGGYGHRDDPARRAGRPDRAARRGPDGRDQPLFVVDLRGIADAVLRVSRTERARWCGEQVQTVEGLAADAGGAGFVWVTTPEDRAAALEGAARRVLRGARAAARLEGLDDGRLRADLGACRRDCRRQARRRRVFAAAHQW